MASKPIKDSVVKRLHTKLKQAIKGRSLEKLVGKYDTSGDGVLSTAEFRRLIRRELQIATQTLGNFDLNTLATALDHDGDGTLSISELTNFLERGSAALQQCDTAIAENATPSQPKTDEVGARASAVKAKTPPVASGRATENTTSAEAEAEESSPTTQTSNAANLMSQFKQFDINNDGIITRAELGQVLMGLNKAFWTQERVDELMNHVDTGGDGRLDLQEFMGWICQEDNTRTTTAVFADIWSGKVFRISNTEERAITLSQLRKLMEHIRRRTEAESWVSTDPQNLSKVTELNINLYDVAHFVILPATKAHCCSYVEFVATEKQIPKWFVSHWWGEAVADFVRCLEQHSLDRGLEADSPYWVCAYANNQWNVDGEIGDENPKSSSFFKAICLSEGTVSVLNDSAVCWTRVWCCFEVWLSLLQEDNQLQGIGSGHDSYLYDMYTSVGTQAVGITDGLAYVDTHDFHPDFWTDNKFLREKSFPPELTQFALRVQLQEAKATRQIDRWRILNCISGNAELDAEPPATHERYDELNCILRGRCAAATWRGSLEANLDLTPHMEALANSMAERLDLSFDGCVMLTDDTLQLLAEALPRSLRDLKLDMTNCSITSLDPLGRAIATMPNLTHLRLRCAGCESLESTDELGKAFHHLRRLQVLSLDFESCRKFNSWKAVGDGLKELKGSLVSLTLCLKKCVKVDTCRHLSQGVLESRKLVSLHLDFSNCALLNDVNAFGPIFRRLTSLRYFKLYCPRCLAITSLREFWEGFRYAYLLLEAVIVLSGCGITNIHGLKMPNFTSMQSLTLDFSGCSELNTLGMYWHDFRNMVQLETLFLSFRGCLNAEDISASKQIDSLSMLNEGLKDVTCKSMTLDFRDCVALPVRLRTRFMNRMLFVQGLAAARMAISRGVH